MTDLATPTHEMPYEGLETEELIGCLKGISEGLIERDVPRGCSRIFE